MKSAFYNTTLARLLTASLVAASVLVASPRLMAAEIPTKLKNASQIQQQLLTAGSVRVIAFVATDVDQKAVRAALSDRAARGQMIRNMNARISPVMLSFRVSWVGDRIA